MSVSRKWYRRAIVRAIECVIIAFKYAFWVAVMLGGIYIVCLIASLLLKPFGIN